MVVSNGSSSPYERPKLNERPIYLHCYYILLALVQSTLHLYFDWDQVPVPVTKRTPESADQRTHIVEPLLTRIRKAIPQIFYDVVVRSVITAVVGPFIYMLLLRRVAWSWTLYVAKLLDRKSTRLNSSHTVI